MSDSFFKYTTLESAIKIVQSKCVQFSCPSLFNDPFDTLIPFRSDYSSIKNSKKTMDTIFKNQLSQRAWTPTNLPKEITDLKQKIKQTSPNESELLTERKAMLQELEANGRIANPKLIKNLHKFLLKSIKPNNYQYAKKSYAIEEGVQKNIQSIADDHFIFSASTVKNSILMWSHYSEEHTGVVLEFSKTQNSFFKNLKEVQYIEERPTLDNKIFYSKAKCWDYEKEIRCVINGKDYDIPSQHSTALLPYNQNDLLSIYFGCNMKDTKKERVDALTTEAIKNNPNIIFYQMKTDNERYRLNHELI